MKRFFLTALLVFLLGMQTFAAEPFIIAVMDPLAKELACACIDGYAQRDYKALAVHLKNTGNPAFATGEIVFAGSVQAALQKSSKKRVDMIIGEDSVVRAELQKAKIPVTAIARLSDKQGTTGFTGLVVVAADDPAKSIADLKNHRLLLGPVESNERHAAAIKLFEKHGVAVPKQPEVVGRCSEAAHTILENESDKLIAAVLSDYSFALLEGCETIEKGALRVLDKTEPVPFIGVFVTETVDKKVMGELYTALMNCKTDAKLLKMLETKEGFVHYGKIKVEDITAMTVIEEMWESFPITKAEDDSKN
jgi:ABC-type phosphate/phosphonate transport system substrate-binding protein